MTTEARQKAYENEHKNLHGDSPYFIYNPNNKPIDELPIVFGFNNGGPPMMLSAIAMSEDGKCLGGHCCSNECYMPYDLGLINGSRQDRQEEYKKYYPNGFRCEFVSFYAVKSNEKLMNAIKIDNGEKND